MPKKIKKTQKIEEKNKVQNVKRESEMKKAQKEEVVLSDPFKSIRFSLLV